MSRRAEEGEPELSRFPTGVRGLDAVLGGGLLRGGTYLVRGAPGAGKTVLANQIAYLHAAAGGKVLYVTLLAESHARLLLHLRSFDFFDPHLVPSAVYYVSGFTLLDTGGLAGLLELVRREVRAHAATLLVIDGLACADDAAMKLADMRRFIHELQTYVSLAGCTALLLRNHEEGRRPEQVMVDGMIELVDRARGDRDVRDLHVIKLRGSAHLTGRHVFRIGSAGVVVSPRLEEVYASPSGPFRGFEERVPVGVAAVDAMLGGGLPSGSTTVLLGPPGSGKTSFCQHFLASASRDEPGLLFGFYERPDLTLLKADRFALPLRDLVARGVVELVWRPPTENLVDELGHELIQVVLARGVRRLVIDGIGPLQDAAPQERFSRLFTALTNELRSHGVTTLYTAEVTKVLTAELDVPIPGMSAVFDNLLLFRYVEHEGRVRRALSVTKVRDSAYDDRVRLFELVPGAGLVLAEDVEVSGPVKATPVRKRQDARKGGAKRRRRGERS